MESIYRLHIPEKIKYPILVSIPHAGTIIPDEINARMNQDVISILEDTDWYVDRLYQFCHHEGIPMIIANYHRWVIDLNRNPDNQSLYNDGRVITELCPTKTFNNEALYHSGKEPDKNEIENRKETFYKPYHNKIQELLNEIKNQFGLALLFDAHSIKKQVPGISKKPFPDFILGDNDNKSAAKEIIVIADKTLSSNNIGLYTHNHPFKGGQITRSFGDPSNNIHALQLEMAKVNYMNDDETKYDCDRAEKIQKELLSPLFSSLGKYMLEMSEKSDTISR
ncbi:N-formylglutamate amidohydrolase [Marinigracilibium pacificum]|uniref:N-formylglutamate deformylase n=1 Tax=Marinigracilibium pacificum TaxID=2729599 RepID=A0A848IYH7_9BACT|nr:N-formylglutamate amidohydrolase [Marinigracilibium pacificum]NMM48381.1 N-formylglutamate deformylase [Marinigracilibium pacificum]